MAAMAIRELDSSTIRFISGTAVIHSVHSVVKELFENSIDAGADNIIVKLEKNGCTRIEVRDNGSGITKSNAPLFGRANHTSKIADFSDLEKLCSYGFRGQAINSLCAVSDVSFTTRTDQEEFALTYTLDEEGKIISSKPSAHLVGTTVVVENLFARIPVRRKMLSSSSPVRAVQRLLRYFGLAKPKLSISLSHDGSVVWRKSSTSSLYSSAQEVMGYKLAAQMQYISWKGSQASIERVEEENADISLEEDPVCLEMEVEMLVPKKGINILEVSSFPAPGGYIPNVYLLINGRPMKHKKIEELMNMWIGRGTLGELPKRKKPAWVLKLELPPDKIDVNLEADKTKIHLHGEDVLLSRIEEILSEYYLIVNSDQNSPITATVTTALDFQKTSENGLLSEGKSLCESQEEYQKLSSFENTTDTSRKIPNSRKITHDLCPSQELPAKQRKVSEEVEVVNNEDKDKSDNNSSSPAPSLLQIFNVDSFAQRLDSHKENDKDKEILEIQIPVLPTNNNYSSPRKDPEKVDVNLNERETDISAEIYLDNDWDSELVKLDIAVDDGMKEDSKKASLPSFHEVVNETTVTEIKESNNDLVYDNVEVINVQDTEENDESVLPHVDDWSRGKASFAGSKVLNPVKLLGSETITSNVIDLISDDKRDKSKLNHGQNNLHKNSKELNTLNKNHVMNINDVLMTKSPLPHACSQMGRRDMQGFQEFSSSQIPKIHEKNPGIKSSEVAELLVREWKCLSRTEQDLYERKAQHLISSRHQKVRENNFSPCENKSMKQAVLTESFSATPRTSKPQRLSKQLLPSPIYERDIEVSMKQIANYAMQKETKKSKERKLEGGKIKLLGQLKPSGMWVFQEECEVGIIRHYALQEVVVFQNLMNTLTIPLSALPKPIKVNESNLGSHLLENLLSLERQYDIFTENTWVTSKVLSKNGFRIKITNDEEGKSCGVITEIASVLPSYGIKDLKEILNKNCLESCNLSESRPLMVVDYIKSEAVRMCRQSPLLMGKEDLNKLLKNWSGDRKSLCLHSRPIFHFLYNFKHD